MRTTSRARRFGVCAVLVVAAGAHAGGVAAPDAIVGAVNQGNYFGEVNGVAAYAFGYATCNIGDAPLVYEASTSNHPVWAQNLYRLKGGVFEQIGMSHLVHGFFALEQNLCSPCSPSGQGGGLGPGCSDVNSAGLAGSQHQLGPRWQVNATTGQFPFPYFAAPYEATTGRRLQVRVEDVDPALNADAIYWAEVQVVAPGEALASDGTNNASCRRVMFGANLDPALLLVSERETAAIQAWAQHDPEVLIEEVDTGEGVLLVASRAYDRGDGTWLYTYAIHNLNADRSARAFEFDIGSGSVTDPGFSSPFYHSGDGIDGVTFPNEPWQFSFMDEAVRWETEPFSENPNANAIRWGTTYSFWFTSTREPSTFDANITLFKPGAVGSVIATVIKPRSCLGDIDNGGTVNFGDLNYVLADFGQVGEDLVADTNNDGAVDFQDLNIVLTEFGREDCY